MSDRTYPSISRRTALKLGLGIAVAPAMSSVLSACSGASTSGGGNFTFLSTQFTPVQEKSNFEAILKTYEPKGTTVNYNPMTVGDLTTQLTSQEKAGKVSINLVGGLHGDLAGLTDNLQDLTQLKSDLDSAGIPADLWNLANFGGSAPKYVPWMQATYLIAAHKSTLQYLPSGADQNNLTYDQYLQWATNAKKGFGKPVFGFPAGPTGLYHRWFQGFLLPSYSGHQVQDFASAASVTAWRYMRNLWAQMTPASTNFNSLQDPMATGEVLAGWDHVARLVKAPATNPDQWVMLPSPTGPKGQAYMLVIAGMAVPKGADLSRASAVIKALTAPAPQGETLAKNAFFPVVKGDLPTDLPPAVAMEATAVKQQQTNPRALVALPPVGVGTKDGDISQVYKDCFTQICLQGKDIATTLRAEAQRLQGILDQLKVPCWAPDTVTPGQTCQAV